MHENQLRIVALSLPGLLITFVRNKKVECYETLLRKGFSPSPLERGWGEAIVR